MTTQQTLRIREFNPYIILKRILSEDTTARNGMKLVFIGMPKSGKSTAIKSIINLVKNIIPVGLFMSGTEQHNHTYGNLAPETFIYEEYDEKVLEDFEKRQKLAVEHLSNPWALLVIDDCTDEPQIFKKPIQQRLFKNGRHYQMLYMLSLQYSLDVNPAIRTSIDATFLFRDPNLKNRKNLYENYAGIIPDFSTFCQLMDQLTGEYQCLVISNMGSTNNLEECVFFYKADRVDNLTFGCNEYWNFHEDRYNKEYKPNV